MQDDSLANPAAGTTKQPTGFTPVQLTLGAGLAIAGVWLSAAGLTVAMFVILLPASAVGYQSQDVGSFEASGIILLFASPMIAAYSATSKIVRGK